MIQIFGTEIPNQLNELTVEQFDHLNKIENNIELDTIEKWIEKFIYLGVEEKAFDSMELDEFANYIKEFNKSDIPSTEKVTKIVIDKYTYEANEQIGVKDLGMIEKVADLPSEEPTKTPVSNKKNDQFEALKRLKNSLNK